MIRKTEDTWYASIWIAGDVAEIERICQKWVFTTPTCVTVTPTTFVYTGGKEVGACVRLINYPRFPKAPNVVTTQAMALAEHLIKNLGQWSASVETPKTTTFMTRREG